MIHEKRSVVRDKELSANEWYVDITLKDGRRVQGLALIEWAGCDFTDLDGEPFETDTDGEDWLAICDAAETSSEPYIAE